MIPLSVLSNQISINKLTNFNLLKLRQESATFRIGLTTVLLKIKLPEQVLGEIEKRAALGFQGTRGTKTYMFEYPQGYEKRLLAMGFQGMRGKKNESPAEWEKRAPMGFQGMRGKKALLDEIEELEKRAVMGFQVSAGLEQDRPKESERKGETCAPDFIDYLFTCDPSFQGTRGKKNDYESYLDYYMDPMDLDKRVSVGFQGMRGKKDSDKRAPMGFQGMRGKRNMAQRFGTDFETRSPIDYQGNRS